ncbi:MAG: copper chaperone [Bacteroidetes bacterium]|nr:MAG: copper chaperone [Bacteroidota bacterium]
MTYTFKTNINCGGCIATVTPFMEKATGITSWAVDTNNPEKILTVETDCLNEAEVMAVVQEAGFQIEPKKKGLLGKLFG